MPGARRARARRGSRRAPTPPSQASSTRCCATTSGRPTPALPRARPLGGGRRRGLAQARGPAPHRRAQDQQRARPGAARQADGQAARDRRDRRGPARRGGGHGLRAARPRVRRLHGHRGHAPPAAERRAHAAARRRGRGRRGRRPHAEGGRLARRSATGSRTSRRPTTSSARRSARRPTRRSCATCSACIGDEARAQLLEAAGRLPDRVIACVGGGSNAIGTFVPFVDDDDVELIGVEAAGEGLDTRPPRRAADDRRARRPARRDVGRAPGRGGPDPRGALDLRRARLPGRRARARLAARQRAASATWPSTTTQALARVPARRRARGDHPGARVRARDRLAARQPRRRALDLLTLSGRGDKDLAEVLGARGDRERRDTGIDRIAAASPATASAAALMPYLMGGYPDLDASIEAGLAAADAGADLVELGVPFSDPLADGPVIHAAGNRGARRRACTLHGVLGVCERARRARLPVVLMVYANAVADARRPSASRCAPPRPGAAGLIVPDLPHDEAGEVRAACDAAGPRARAARRADDHARADRARSARTPAASSTRSRSPARPASATSCAPELGAHRGARARRDRGAGGRRLRHLDRRTQARAVAEIADGVIVGSRLVRAAGEGGAGAVGEPSASWRGAALWRARRAERQL